MIFKICFKKNTLNEGEKQILSIIFIRIGELEIVCGI